MSSKQYCERCEFLVNPIGHSERCEKKTPKQAKMGSETRALAWLGDTLQALDVKVYLLTKGYVDTNILGYLVSRAEQAKYLRAKVPEIDMSEEELSNEFEKRYVEDSSFRVSYLEHLDQCDLESIKGTISARLPHVRFQLIDNTVSESVVERMLERLQNTAW